MLPHGVAPSVVIVGRGCSASKRNLDEDRLFRMTVAGVVSADEILNQAVGKAAQAAMGGHRNGHTSVRAVMGLRTRAGGQLPIDRKLLNPVFHWWCQLQQRSRCTRQRNAIAKERCREVRWACAHAHDTTYHHDCNVEVTAPVPRQQRRATATTTAATMAAKRHSRECSCFAKRQH
jgi:hypothetical protein